MKRKRSILLILMCFLCVIYFCVISCNTRQISKDSASTVNLSIWHYYFGDAKVEFENLVREFNETIGHENKIYITATAFPSIENLADELIKAVKEEVGASEIPNIFSTYTDNAYRLDKYSIIADLDEYFTQQELLSYRSDFLTEGRFGSFRYLKVLPVVKSSECLFLNYTDFLPFSDEVGISLDQLSTWESLSNVAELYYNWTDSKTTKLHDGEAFFGIDSLTNFLTVGAQQIGTPFFTENTNSVSFSKDHARKVWDYFYIPYISGYFTSKTKYRGDDVKVGNIIAYVGSTAGAVHFPKSVEKAKDLSYPIVAEVLPYPIYENSSNVIIQRGAGMSVTKNTLEKEEAAVKFLKWFISPERNLDFAINMGYIPVQKNVDFSADVLPKLQDRENTTVFKTAESFYTFMSDFAYHSVVPFDGSYEAKKTMQDELELFVKNTYKEIVAQIEAGGNRKTLIEYYSSEEMFEKWYRDFTDKISSTIQ